MDTLVPGNSVDKVVLSVVFGAGVVRLGIAVVAFVGKGIGVVIFTACVVFV